MQQKCVCIRTDFMMPLKLAKDNKKRREQDYVSLTIEITTDNKYVPS